MRIKLAITIMLVGVLSISYAAETAVLQIQRQYPVTALSGDGATVVHTGTILVIQTPNVWATSAVGRFGAYPNTFKGGKINGPAFVLKKTIEMYGGARPLQMNEQVYLTKVEVNKDGNLVFSVQTSEDKARATVTFQVGQGALDGTDAAPVQAMISKVFTIAPAADAAAPAAAESRGRAGSSGPGSASRAACYAHGPDSSTSRAGCRHHSAGADSAASSSAGWSIRCSSYGANSAAASSGS